MDDFAPAPRPRSPGPRQVVRLLLPAFAISTLVVVIGIVFIVTHHRTIGVVLVVLGAAGGLFLRAAIMLRNQQGPRPRT